MLSPSYLQGKELTVYLHQRHTWAAWTGSGSILIRIRLSTHKSDFHIANPTDFTLQEPLQTWKAEAICRVTRARNPRETRRFRLHISLSPWRGFYLVVDPSNGAYPCPGSRHVFRTKYTRKKWQTNMFFWFFLRNTDLEPVNNKGHVHTAPFRMDFCCCFRRRWAPFQWG